MTANPDNGYLVSSTITATPNVTYDLSVMIRGKMDAATVPSSWTLKNGQVTAPANAATSSPST